MEETKPCCRKTSCLLELERSSKDRASPVKEASDAETSRDEAADPAAKESLVLSAVTAPETEPAAPALKRTGKKAALNVEAGDLVEKCRLTFKRKRLQDGSAVADCSIAEGSTVHMHAQTTPPGPNGPAQVQLHTKNGNITKTKFHAPPPSRFDLINLKL